MAFVVLHVSAPYKSTDFTFELKIFIFVPLEMFLALHDFPRMLKMTLALLILFFTLASMPQLDDLDFTDDIALSPVHNNNWMT
jgi:hypothetical protein